MSFISRRKKKTIENIEKEIALEIVEIFEEKLEELGVSLPENLDEIFRIKSKVRNDLIYEIENFLYSNKYRLVKKTA